MRSASGDRLASAIGWVAVVWLALTLLLPTPAEAPTPAVLVTADLVRRAAADGVVVAVRATDTATVRVVALVPKVRRAVRDTRAAADSVSAFADFDSLSCRITHMTSVVDSLTDAVDTLLVRHDAERAAFRVTLEAADRQLSAEREARLAAQAAAVCKVGPMPCPSRRTAFVLGFAAAVAVIVLR